MSPGPVLFFRADPARRPPTGQRRGYWAPSSSVSTGYQRHEESDSSVTRRARASPQPEATDHTDVTPVLPSPLPASLGVGAHVLPCRVPTLLCTGHPGCVCSVEGSVVVTIVSSLRETGAETPGCSSPKTAHVVAEHLEVPPRTPAARRTRRETRGPSARRVAPACAPESCPRRPKTLGTSRQEVMSNDAPEPA